MRLTKHHGLGNDFLVLLDRPGGQPLTPDLVRSLCDRYRGIGADGVMRATLPPGRGDGEGDEGGAAVDAVMELFNADGSRAEMSGNGIRCLAQALLLDGWGQAPAVRIRTAAGLRTISVHDPVDGLTARLEVDMGAAHIEGDAPEWAGGPLARARWANMGNPHLVVEVAGGADAADLAGSIDLVALGEKVNATVDGGANVHLLTAPGAGTTGDGDRIAIRTYERGVGLTQACGTGACASAAVAHAWGLVGDRVAVDQPGGTAEVRVGGTIALIGPAAFIATVELPA
jgi:diaminopimelate epimerase